MTLVQQLIVLIILFLCVYMLIDRICKCIEHCATAKAYSKFRENGVLTSLERVQEQIQKFGEVRHEAKNEKSGMA